MITRMLSIAALAFAAMPTVAVAPAVAASFDCAKASTAFERAICDNDDLSAIDEQLAVAYASAIGGLSKAATATMRENQRDWLAYTERACTADAEPQTTDYVEDQHNCLHSLLYNRVHELEPSRMMSGWRFYLDETFKIAKADQEESGSEFSKVATAVYSSPRIDGDSTTAREFNAFASDLLTTVSEGRADSDAQDLISDVDTRLEVTSATSSRITITTTDWWYGHGAAHGNYTVTYAHFLVADGRPLAAEDVFANADGWQEPLAALTKDALKASLGEDMWDDLDATIADAVVDPRRWNFSKEGLILQFQPYEVTAYAAGAPTVTVPWGALEPYLTGTIYGVAAY